MVTVFTYAHADMLIPCMTSAPHTKVKSCRQPGSSAIVYIHSKTFIISIFVIFVHVSWLCSCHKNSSQSENSSIQMIECSYDDLSYASS